MTTTENSVVLYQSPDGSSSLEVRLDQETVWLNQAQQGTRFRQWVTSVLHDHIIKGYTINEQRFRERAEKLTAMQQTVALLARTLTNQELINDTGRMTDA